MISLEEVRQVVTREFKLAHEAAYPTMLVNYPNFLVVDIEHQVDPFINISIDFGDTSRAAMGEREIMGQGTLVVIFYYKEGGGTSGAYSYTDFLNTALSMQELNSLYYSAASTIPIQTFPGWKGIMNRLAFEVVG